MHEDAVPVSAAWIQTRILEVRGHRVMLDSDLARLYGVKTARLNEQVRRNPARFPPDFAWLLTGSECSALMSQTATSKIGRGGRRKPPWVFTEHGAVMLANVLRSPTAVAASLQVVRAFVHLRRMAAEHADLAHRLDELEQRHDAKFGVVFQAIRQLMEPPQPQRGRIGFELPPA